MKWSNSLALVASAFFDLVDAGKKNPSFRYVCARCRHSILLAVVLFVGIWGHVVTKNRANFMHSYGFERFEVITRFATSTYFSFVCLWVFFEGIERILEVEPTFIHGTYLIHIGLMGVALQVVHTVVFRKYALSASYDRHCFHFFGIERFSSHSRNFLLLGSTLTAGSHTFALAWEFLADALVALTGFVIQHRGYMLLDTFVALFLTTLIAYQMLPVMKESALILLQSTPERLPIAKMMREVSTVDGVLEVRKEHFWSVGAAVHVGTLRVRVRNEVSEGLVLRKITALCAPYVRHLTIQVEKDSWEMKRL